jgi:hypothetical protein
MCLHDLLPGLVSSQVAAVSSLTSCGEGAANNVVSGCVKSYAAAQLLLGDNLVSAVSSHPVQPIRKGLGSGRSAPVVHMRGQRCDALAEVCGCSLLVLYLPLSHTCAVAAGSSHC